MIDLMFVTPTAVERHSLEELPTLGKRTDGFLWLDLPECDEADTELLRTEFGCHPLALAACRERNPVPTLHRYPDSMFVVMHVPQVGQAGHVHMLEIDSFIADRHLITVHGPLNPAVLKEAALTETRTMIRRIEQGRLHPHSPSDLSYAIASAGGRRQRAAIDDVARKVASLEQRVMQSDFRNPEALLTEMFLVRHELLTVRTMAAQTDDVFGRMARLLPEGVARDHAADLADQFERIRNVADGEKEFLLNVIDLYGSRVDTKMTMAMERLAVLAAVTLPVTALASVYGMNVIVNERTHVLQLLLVLAVMATISVSLLRWTKRQGWW
jgi:magnesium transporter